MLRFLVLVSLVLILTVTSASPAEAGMLISAIVGAVFTGLGATAVSLISAGITMAIGLGVSLIGRRILKNRMDKSQAGGVEMDVQVDDDVPEAIILGRFITAGSLVYLETFGKNGDTENSDMVEIITVADVPTVGLVELFVDGEKKTFSANHPIDGGKIVADHDGDLSIKYWDGSQTTADSWVVSKLGTHSERPWTNNHVGRGRSFVRLHYRFNPDEVEGRKRFRYVIDGMRLYDPRLDSTNDGSGSHRYDDLSTHAFTQNLPLMIYNILRGIQISTGSGTELIYGLGIAAEDLPNDIWFAAMNEADEEDDADRRKYWGGVEIYVDQEPLEVIRELAAAMGARFVEIGGTYKLYLTPVMTPVITINDGFLRADRDDVFRPVITLEGRINYLTGAYLDPDTWQPNKDTPPLKDADWEAEDGRRLPEDFTNYVIQSAEHFQRVRQQLFLRSRNQRRHDLPLSRLALLLEPGDVMEWNSERNGYVEKLFEVDAVDYAWDLSVEAHITELDPNDYDWDADTDYVAPTPVSINNPRPAAVVISDFDVEGVIVVGDNGSRKVGVEFTWTDPDDPSVVGVEMRVRRVSDPNETASFSHNDPTTEIVTFVASFAEATSYEAQARFVKLNGSTSWTLWIPFTTPSVGVSLDELDLTLQARLQHLEESIPNDLFTLRQDLDEIAGAISTHVTTLSSMVGKAREAIGIRHGELTAGIEEVRYVAATNGEVLAAFLLDLFAVNPDTGEAYVNFRAIAQAATDGALAAVAFQLRAGQAETDEWAVAALELAALYDAVDDLYYSRIQMIADRINLVVRGTTVSGSRLTISDLPFTVPVVSGEVDIDLTQQRQSYRVLLNANTTINFPGGEDGINCFEIVFVQDGTGSRTVSWGSGWIGTAPTILATANSISWVKCLILSRDPDVAMATLMKSSTASGLPTDFEIIIDDVGTHKVILPTFNTLNIEAIGPSGGSGGGGVSSGTPGGNASPTLVEIPGFTTLSAGGGGGGKGREDGGTGGIAGVAAGGNHTNTNGQAGQTGYSDDDGRHGGKGGDAPNGGTGAPKTNAWSAGRVGNAPGGGSSGGASNWGDKGGGGSGSGAYVRSSWTFGVGSHPAAGLEITVKVRDGGSPGTGHSPGAKGAKGRVRIWGN